VSAVTDTHWEVGGEYHSPVETPRPFHPWPRPSVWYALGRHAVEALVEQLRPRAVWIPDYFCHEVVPSWERLASVQTFEDDPRWPEPRWETIRARRGDIVLAVNYFGAREGSGWAEHAEDFVLVEDHSHDPFSPWAAASTAPYGCPDRTPPSRSIQWASRRR